MPPHDQPTTSARPHKGTFSRHVLPLILLVAIVGGVAWVAQNLPRWQQPKKINVEENGSREKPSLEFIRVLAQWGQQAEALGWTSRDLFGLHKPPDKPAPSYRRLSRYDETGLIWLSIGA